MNDRDVMQQALEALERNASQDMSVVQSNMLAVRALRARLAEHETCKPALQVEGAEPVAWMGVSGAGEVVVSKSRLYSFMTMPLYTAPPTRRPLTPVQEAAPELLEALCALVLGIDAGGATLDDMREARAAIAKAEGGNDE